MSNNSFFNYGDVVKLKRDSEYNDLKINDYGIVWAVYAYENESSLEFDYEGTFWNEKGDCHDEMFEKHEVEKVLRLEEAPFSKDMQEFWRFINEKREE